jgi:hypothetical protein
MALHAALNNVTPADVYNARDFKILERREQIKQKPMILRSKQNELLVLLKRQHLKERVLLHSGMLVKNTAHLLDGTRVRQAGMS